MWGIVPILVLASNIVYVPANTNFKSSWSPIASTVDYRIVVDGKQVGSDFPKSFFSSATWAYGPAETNRLHSFEVFSIDANGAATPIPVTINGQGLRAPQNPRLRALIYVENPPDPTAQVQKVESQ